MFHQGKNNTSVLLITYLITLSLASVSATVHNQTAVVFLGESQPGNWAGGLKAMFLTLFQFIFYNLVQWSHYCYITQRRIFWNMWIELALTVPPSHVSTGLSSPPLVTRETRRECRSPLVTDASSAFGARSLHKAWRQRQKIKKNFWILWGLKQINTGIVDFPVKV